MEIQRNTKKTARGAHREILRIFVNIQRTNQYIQKAAHGAHREFLRIVDEDTKKYIGNTKKAARGALAILRVQERSNTDGQSQSPHVWSLRLLPPREARAGGQRC